ncbi:MAG: hypothetical protein R3C28_20475 [Pirellulaceae bacterium]
MRVNFLDQDSFLFWLRTLAGGAIILASQHPLTAQVTQRFATQRAATQATANNGVQEEATSSAIANAFGIGGGDTDSNTRARNSRSLSDSQNATSRSVSVTQNGKQVSISESSDAGISVTIKPLTPAGGAALVVKAANPQALGEKSKEAFDLYQKYLGKPGDAMAIGRGAPRANVQNHASNSTSGKSVSITENNDSGITVTISETVNGDERTRTVQAADAAELKRKDPEAFRLYQARGAHDPNELARESRDMLKDEIRKLRDQNADRPELGNLIDRLLQDLDP